MAHNDLLRTYWESGSALSSSEAGFLICDMGPMLQGNSLVRNAGDIRELPSEMERDQEVQNLRRRLADAEIEQAYRKSKIP
jgi:hypothetical protein